MTNIRRDSISETGFQVNTNSVSEDLNVGKEALMPRNLRRRRPAAEESPYLARSSISPRRKRLQCQKQQDEKERPHLSREPSLNQKKRLFITPKSQRRIDTPDEVAGSSTAGDDDEDDDDEDIWHCRLCGRRQLCLIDQNGKDVMCGCTPSFKILWEVNGSSEDEVEEESYSEDESVQEGA